VADPTGVGRGFHRFADRDGVGNVLQLLGQDGCPGGGRGAAGEGAVHPTAGVQQVLVHVVGRNESWSSVAALYDTSQAVLMTANPPGDTPGASLAPGRLLVVLPGITDPAGLRPLAAYWIPLPMRVAEAASRYGVSEEEIRFWNQTQGEWVEGQRWLVVGLPS
jgi:hypothetical protein